MAALPTIEILHSPGCGNVVAAHATVRQVVADLWPAAHVEVIDVTSKPENIERFAGSPSVLVDGVDLEQWVQPRLGAG